MDDYEDVEGVSELLTENGHSDAHSVDSNREHIPKGPERGVNQDHHESDALGVPGGSARVESAQGTQARTSSENRTSTPSEEPRREEEKQRLFSTSGAQRGACFDDQGGRPRGQGLGIEVDSVVSFPRLRQRDEFSAELRDANAALERASYENELLMSCLNAEKREKERMQKDVEKMYR